MTTRPQRPTPLAQIKRFHDEVWRPNRDGGTLFTFHGDRVELLSNSASGLPWARFKSLDDGRWLPAKRHTELRDIVRKVSAFGEWVRRRRYSIAALSASSLDANESFLATIDPAHLSAVTAFPVHTFHLYGAIRRLGPRLVGLMNEPGEAPELAGGGALAYALARVGALARLGALAGSRPDSVWRLAAELLAGKRRDIAMVFGVPPATAGLAVHVLGRVPRIDINDYTLTFVFSGLRIADSRTIKLYAHARRINRDVAELLSMPATAAHVSPALLHEIGAGRDHSDADSRLRIGSVVDFIRDTVEMLVAHGHRVPQLRSIAQVVELHDTEVETSRDVRLARWRETPETSHSALVQAPIRDLPDQIQFLSSARALAEEGLEMRNCVGVYGQHVARAELFVFRVLVPERATLAIKLEHGDRFAIDQISGPRNAQVKAETIAAVETWLRDNHDPEAVERVRAMSGALRQRSKRLVARGVAERALHPRVI